MNVLVIGASQGIGRQTVKAALAKGYKVTAFSRSPEKLGINNPDLKYQAGNVLDRESIEKVIAGHDVVICTLGLSTPKAIGPPVAKRSYVLSSGTRNIVAAMEKAGIKRFICVTAIGTSESVARCSLLTRISLRYVLKWVFSEKDVQEKIIKSSRGLDWTIIRPTTLTNGPAIGAAIANDIHCGLFTHISRADVAAMMFNVVDQKASYKKVLILSYPARFGDSLRWAIDCFGKRAN